MTASQPTWLVPGPIDGTILRLDEPLSFWGGVDAAEGKIVDQAHPQHGTRFEGRVVVMPGTRGSSGTPGVLGETLRLGVGPSAIIVPAPDINLVAGSLAAAALYGTTCPVLVLPDSDYSALRDGDRLLLGPPNDAEDEDCAP